jgi:hypothetical protein
LGYCDPNAWTGNDPKKAGKQHIRDGKTREECLRIISPELATVKMDYEEKNAGFEKALNGTC